MKQLRGIASTVLELFVDDPLFALCIAAWVAAIAGSEALALGTPELRSVALFAGMLAILLAGVVRGSRV